MYPLVTRRFFFSLPILLLLVVIAPVCPAQKPVFSWSEKFTTKGDFRFAGYRDSNFYAFQSRGNKEAVVRSFSQGLLVKEERILSFATGENPANYLLSFISDTGLVHVSYLHDKRKDSMFIYNGSRCISSMKASSTSFVQAFYSADRSKLLICNFYIHRKSKNADRDFIVLSTASGQSIYSGTFSYNYIQQTPESIDIDNLGNAYFGTTSYQQRGSKLSGKSDAIHHLQLFSPRGTGAAFTFHFPGKYIPGIDVVQGNNNRIYIAGLAYDGDVKASRTSSADLFLYRIDPVQSVYADSAYLTIQGLYPEGKLKADDRLPYSFRYIYENTSGELVLLAEQYQQTISQYMTKERYHDIACIRLQRDRSFGSLARIPKLQFDFDNPSVVGTFIDDQVFLLYNDLQENLEATGESLKFVANKKEKNGLFLVTIGPEGQMKKELLYGYDTDNPMPLILYSSILNDRTIFFCADEQVGIVKFLSP